MFCDLLMQPLSFMRMRIMDSSSKCTPISGQLRRTVVGEGAWCSDSDERKRRASSARISVPS